jgi:hypothetical protein
LSERIGRLDWNIVNSPSFLLHPCEGSNLSFCIMPSYEHPKVSNVDRRRRFFRERRRIGGLR